MAEEFDWTQHMHDQLGDMLIRLVSLQGKQVEDFGLMEPGATKRVQVEIKVNGVEVSYAAFVETCFSVDNEMLQAAARDVIEKRFGPSLDALEKILRQFREEMHSEVIQQLLPEWERIVKEGPKKG